MSAVKSVGSVEAMLAAVATHPIRVQALTILTERVASPKQIADELGVAVGHVSYHVRVLRDDLSLIEVVDEKKVRGAVQHFYKAVKRPQFSDEEWAELSVDERNSTSLYLLQLVLADASAALDAGTMDARPDRYLTRVPGLVDSDGWNELNQLYGEMLDRILKIFTSSADRMAGDPAVEQIPVSTVALFFERAVGAQRGPRDG